MTGQKKDNKKFIGSIIGFLIMMAFFVYGLCGILGYIPASTTAIIWFNIVFLIVRIMVIGIAVLFTIRNFVAASEEKNKEIKILHIINTCSSLFMLIGFTIVFIKLGFFIA